MSKRAVLLLNVLALLAMLLTPALVSAAPPAPADQNAKLVAPPHRFLEVASAPAAQLGSDKVMSEAVSEATAMRQSLSAEQQKQVGAIIAKYQPELAAAAKNLPAIKELSPMGDDTVAQLRSRAAREAKLALEVKKAAEAGEAIMANMVKEISSVLTAAQASQFQAGLAASRPSLVAAAVKAIGTRGMGTIGPMREALNTTACFYGGYYASVADFDAFIAYSWAYLNYIAPSSSTLAYNAYYYSYWGQAYLQMGLHDAGGAYFDMYAWGRDRNGFRTSAINNLYNGYLNAYYGEYYAYNDYLPTATMPPANSLAYWSYYYGYYAQYFGYLAYVAESHC
jgi:hypothetical protein